MAEKNENNPFGIIPQPSPAQFFEARSFDRIYSGNPYAQVAFIQTLVGLHEVADRAGGRDGSEISPEEARDATKLVLNYFCDQYAEWREERFDLDGDFGLPKYVADSNFVRFVDYFIAGED